MQLQAVRRRERPPPRGSRVTMRSHQSLQQLHLSEDHVGEHDGQGLSKYGPILAENPAAQSWLEFRCISRRQRL